jgi:hypothetical protein
MISRALIRVEGRPGVGKTLFIEQLLRSFDDEVLVARCLRDESARSLRESAPKTHPELRRYRQAGASGTAIFTCPVRDLDTEDLYSTRLMEDYAKAVVLEDEHGSLPADVIVYVAPALAPGDSLLVRRQHDREAAQRAQMAEMERTLGEPDGIEKILCQMVGEAAMRFLAADPNRVEQMRDDIRDVLARAHDARPLGPVLRWAVAASYEGIEQAEVVVVNIRGEQERPHAERLIADVARIRKDPEVFDEILGWRGSKLPITAVVANLVDARDTGTRKALARIRRTIRQVAV